MALVDATATLAAELASSPPWCGADLQCTACFVLTPTGAAKQGVLLAPGIGLSESLVAILCGAPRDGFCVYNAQRDSSAPHDIDWVRIGVLIVMVVVRKNVFVA